MGWYQWEIHTLLFHCVSQLTDERSVINYHLSARQCSLHHFKHRSDLVDSGRAARALYGEQERHRGPWGIQRYLLGVRVTPIGSTPNHRYPNHFSGSLEYRHHPKRKW